MCRFFIEMVGKKFLYLLLCIVIPLVVACGEGNRREPGEHNGREEGEERPELPDGSRLTEADRKELADATIRFSGDGVEIVYGSPGVLFVQDRECTETTLRELSGAGHSARFSHDTRQIELDGCKIDGDAVMIGEDGKVQWWRALTNGNIAIYFVISNN